MDKAKEKPILFNSKMVRKILEGKKTCTRRIANIGTEFTCFSGEHEFIRDDFIEGSQYTGYVCRKCGFGVAPPRCRVPIGTSLFRPKYNVGDVLYVRETWAKPYGREIRYAADYEKNDYLSYDDGATMYPVQMIHWSPSIHMPKEYARIFLEITEVKLERLQSMSEEDAIKEGCSAGSVEIKGGPWGVEDDPEFWTAKEAFCDVWNETVKKADLNRFGWDANPWVWVYHFKVIEKGGRHAL